MLCWAGEGWGEHSDPFAMTVFKIVQLFSVMMAVSFAYLLRFMHISVFACLGEAPVRW